MNRIIQGIERFQREVFPLNRDLFERLAAGQNPEALFIACSDSRVSLDLITQTGPGDLFVCRNAGNIVPAYGNSDGVSGTIEFAIAALKIKHIVVCGHSGCGAMKGLLHPENLGSMPAVQEWLRHAEGARCAFDSEHGDVDSPGALNAVTKANVQLQLTHLRTHPKVFAGVRDGSLHLHGWFYQIQTGEVEVLDTVTGLWAPFANAPAIADLLRQSASPEVQHA